MLVLAILAYGLLLPSLGFFWDDWPNAWFLHVLGPGGFPSAFASDRPIIGYFYLLTTPWLGDNSLAWQVFALGCRVLSALALWCVLRLAWPRHPKPALWACDAVPGLPFLQAAAHRHHLQPLLPAARHPSEFAGPDAPGRRPPAPADPIDDRRAARRGGQPLRPRILDQPGGPAADLALGRLGAGCEGRDGRRERPALRPLVGAVPRPDLALSLLARGSPRFPHVSARVVGGVRRRSRDRFGGARPRPSSRIWPRCWL